MPLLLFFPLIGFCQPGSLDDFNPVDPKLMQKVKQIDQFISRFNMEENLDGSTYNPDRDDITRENLIASLFDYNIFDTLSTAMSEQYAAFIRDVCDNDRTLNLHDQGFYAKVLCRVIYKGQPEFMTIVMKNERDPGGNGSRWVMVSARADFFEEFEPNDDLSFIPPNSHNMGFNELERAFDGDHPLHNYAADSMIPNHLDLAAYAIRHKDLVFDYTVKTTFHFLQMDGWLMVVSNFNRLKRNSGWLISDLRRTDERAKRTYMRDVLFLD